MLRFDDRIDVSAADGLTPWARAQFEASGKLYDGNALPPEVRFVVDPDDESSWQGFCKLAKVFDGDVHVYDAWFYMVDSGTIFKAGTTDCVATIIQFGLECDDKVLHDELGTAMVIAGLLPPGDSDYLRLKALVDEP